MPSLYITYYRGTGFPHDQHVSVLARPLEAALQETLCHPALCLPHVGGLAGGLGSHLSHMAPPSGKAMLLDEEVEQWMDAGGLQELHAASHKVILPPGPTHCCVWHLVSFSPYAAAGTKSVTTFCITVQPWNCCIVALPSMCLPDSLISTK